MDLRELIEHRFPIAAAVASRDLDREICEAIGAPVGVYAVPIYTSSLDAALGLVPPNWTAWEIASRNNKTAFIATLSRLDREGHEEFAGSTRQPTPALALCEAVLNALAMDHAA